ncbi:GGDEF domain-containing protein [Vibrio hannami]|uniref:GGDEF domain-containing protein n=1 Tax=Vibrio hannami TaxID=2717094 RepID=UPI00240EDB38|nr:GGDEF domain-containing protein [Vibrio hannami]MDG3087862.1 GGDEF domain-containing protein [Vibrio hannami]
MNFILPTLQSTPDVDEASRDELMFLSSRDIARRSITGVFNYLLIWFALIFSSSLWSAAPELSLFLTCFYVVLACIRLPFIFKFELIYQNYPGLWRNGFPLVILLPALMWGLLCALCFALPELEPYSLYIIISTAGIAGGGIAAFVPSRFLTIGLLTCFLVPSFITLIVIKYENVALTLVFIIYWIGMYSVTREQHKQYWTGLKDSLFIKNHAKELERLNSIDELSGLKNKSFFNKSLSQHTKLTARSNAPLAVMLLDIDNFKLINDKYGHLVGDVSIHKLGEVLKTIIKRDTDVVARFGGDEFAIILPGQDKRQCLELGERICKTVASLNTSASNELKTVIFTVSIGICYSTPKANTHFNELIAQADHALYEAKRQGKNRVVAVEFFDD